MKRILITGANSYIGTSFENWMKQYDGYEISTLDMQNPKWREYDFSGYDRVFHVAGLAHSDPRPEIPLNLRLAAADRDRLLQNQHRSRVL